MKPTGAWGRRRHGLAGLVVLALLGSLAGGCAVRPPLPTPIVSTTDYDYAPWMLVMCLGTRHTPETTAPVAPAGLVPVGALVDAGSARFRVGAAAEAVSEVAGKLARGRFVVARVTEWYIGDIPRGLSASATNYEAVDGAGQVHCVIDTPTQKLNEGTPNTGTPNRFQLLPGGPPVEIALVFDLDPALVKGSYLRAYDMAGNASVSLDIGLS